MLTDTKQIACHGTSFQNVAEAKNYAILLQEYGLCESFSIGRYYNGKYIEIYNSSKK